MMRTAAAVLVAVAGVVIPCALVAYAPLTVAWVTLAAGVVLPVACPIAAVSILRSQP